MGFYTDQLTDVRAAIAAVVEAMKTPDDGQIVTIRGRTIQRRDLSSYLNALLDAEERFSAAAYREVSGPFRVAKLRRPSA